MIKRVSMFHRNSDSPVVMKTSWSPNPMPEALMSASAGAMSFISNTSRGSLISLLTILTSVMNS